MTDREHEVLEAVSKTIRAYDEDTIIEAFRKILDRFNYEVVPRDMGPDETDHDLLVRAFGLDAKVIDITGRWR